MADLFERVGAHQRVLVDAVKTLTPPGGATVVLVQPESAILRYTLDGTDPSRVAGFIVPNGQQSVIPVLGASVLKISSATPNIYVQVQWGKYASPA